MSKNKKEVIRKKKEQSIHLSSFLITINPNQLNKDRIKDLKTSFEKFYDEVKDYIKNKSSKEYKITKFSCQSSIEKGSKRKAYHLHALLRIYHTGKLHINLDKMRDFFNEQIPLGDNKKVYIQCKFVNDPLFSIEKYFSKE